MGFMDIFSGLGGSGTAMLMSWVFWVFLIFVIFFVAVGSMWMRRKGKFIFPAMIFMDNGNGKVGITLSRGGWFKSKKILGGLWDVSGERRLEIKDGRSVQQGSTADLHEINYKAGLMLMEKSDDPKILIPINKANLSEISEKMVFDVAPADYRDACSKIIADSEKEASKNWEQLAQVLVFGFVAMVLFISIIMVIQYSKGVMADSNEIHKEAMMFYDKMLERMGTTPSKTIEGSTAP